MIGIHCSTVGPTRKDIACGRISDIVTNFSLRNGSACNVPVIITSAAPIALAVSRLTRPIGPAPQMNTL